MIQGELIKIGKGKRAHRRWNGLYSYCGLSAYEATPIVEDLPKCKSCERNFEREKEEDNGRH